MRIQEEENKIDIVSMLEKFAKALKKFRIAILAGIAAVTIGYFAYAGLRYQPVYQSQATFSVSADKSAFVNSGTSGLEQIKESLPYILQTDVMKNLVKDGLGLSGFPASMTLTSSETANLFVLKVSSQDAELASQILNQVLKDLPRASVYVLGKIEVDVLDGPAAAGTLVRAHNPRRSLVTGAVLGTFLCFAVLLLYVMTSRTIQKKEDFKKYLSISCIASIPNISFKKRRRAFDKHIHIYNDKVGYGFLEAIRMIRVRVEREVKRTGAQVILVTSSIPGEGKSTVASNLALSLAEKGSRTILVDLDLRNPSIGKVLGLEEQARHGIADLLKGTDRDVAGKELVEQIYLAKDWGLSILFCGEAQNDPTKVLSGGRIAPIIAALKKHYDYVILDTPPAAMLADASAIAECADCAVYVVKQDYARIERIAEGMEALALARTPILGAVLNRVETSLGGYGSYGYGRYGAYGETGKS